MAQSATNDLMWGTTYKKLTTKLAEINTFLQRHARVGSLDTILQTEAGELRRQLQHRLGYLKILWYAEPNETKFEDEVRRILNVMTVFMRARGTRLKTKHDDGGTSTTDHPAGVAVALQEPESATNAQHGLNTDTAEMFVTLTPRAGGAEEQRFTLRPNDVSTMITISTGQFNQRFGPPVHHPGGARVVVGQQEKKLRVRPKDNHPSRMVHDTKVIGDNRQLASCWPPMGTCASCGMEGHRHL